MMGDGKGKVHVRWWGRSASRLCNFSVVPVLETSKTSETSSSRQSQLETNTGHPLRSRARVEGG
jgi:hypothetical protein